MISSLKRLWRDRRGNSLAIAGAALPLVLGSAGLASDTIQWTLWKRQLQRAADSAAMAGVYAISSGKAVGNCANIATSTYANPVAYDLRKNNFVGITTNCGVTNPPSVGGFTTDANAVRVVLEIEKKLAFSGLFLKTAPTIRGISTATIVPSGTYCVISLEDQAVTGINATGSTDVNLGCGMITNSTSMSAAVATGSSNVKATPIAAVGGIPASTHWGTGTVLQPFTLAQDDPFKNVGVPTPTNCGGFPNIKNGDNVTITNPTGVRCFNSDIDPKGIATLEPGIYVLDGAGINMTNTGASLSCNGCTIIMTTSTNDPTKIGKPDISGGTINLTAPDTGCVKGTAGCYDGIVLYQDGRAPIDNSFKINGNNGSFVQGAFYFPRADFEYLGNAGMNSNCLQIVVKKVKFSGSSAVNNTCPANSDSGSFQGKRVRLVE